MRGPASPYLLSTHCVLGVLNQAFEGTVDFCTLVERKSPHKKMLPNTKESSVHSRGLDYEEGWMSLRRLPREGGDTG